MTSRLRAAPLLLFVFVLVVHSAIAVVIGVHGWDDGAITASFANTLAGWGRLALTPNSEVVEGFSSPFWLLLLAGTYRLLPLDFDGMILATQLWSAFFAAVGSVILYDLLRPILRRAALPLSFAVFVSGLFLSETANGMEMSSLSALTLATVWLIRRPRPAWAALFGVAALTPWVRFEAAGYVIAGAVVMVLVSRDYRRAGALLGGAVLSLAALTAIRLAVFDSLVANTILAKRWSPYPHGNSLSQQALMSKTVVKELLYVIAPGAVIAIGGLIGHRTPGFASRTMARLRSRSIPSVIAYAVGYIVGVAGFNLFIGPNWGYLGRMEQSLVALIVVTVVYSAPRAMRSLERPWRLTAVLAALVVLAVGSIDRERIDARWHNESGSGTPAAFRQTGEAADTVRKELDLPVLSVLTPDVGGSSLCCSELETLDLGLLANHELAHDGYGGLELYLEKHKPDVVVTHSVWSDASKIYASRYFRENYSPITVDGTWFYLRDDLLARLGKDCRPIPLHETQSFRYRGDGVDEAYIRTLGGKDVCHVD